jgi:hypothetical protein
MGFSAFRWNLAARWVDGVTANTLSSFVFTRAVLRASMFA